MHKNWAESTRCVSQSISVTSWSQFILTSPPKQTKTRILIQVIYLVGGGVEKWDRVGKAIVLMSPPCGYLVLSPAGELWKVVLTSPQSCFTQGVRMLGYLSTNSYPSLVSTIPRGSNSLVLWSTHEWVKYAPAIPAFRKRATGNCSGKPLICVRMVGAEATWLRHH